MQKVWQTLERLLFLFAKLCKRGEFARIAMVIKSDQVLLPSTGLVFAFSTRNFILARMDLKPDVMKSSVFDWALCFRPSLRSLPFSEFGRLGITSQTHPNMTS